MIMKFKVIVIVLFSLWFLTLPAYIYYSTLDDSDISAPYPSLKSSDQEDSAAALKEKSVASASLMVHVSLAHSPVAHLQVASYLCPIINSSVVILRC